MHSVVDLPEGYRELTKIDVAEKKTAWIVNGLCLGIMAMMALLAAFFVSYRTLFNDNSPEMALKLAVVGVGMFAYIPLHEAVHAVFMRRFSRAKVNFGFTGLYAFAGSQAYYCKRHYLVIALAPAVVWGIIFGVANALVPISWFYVVYFLQIANISGAAGDFYVSWRVGRMPETVLVQDTGTAMTVFDNTTFGGREWN